MASKINQLHQFELTPYPRLLWVAIGRNRFKKELKYVPKFNSGAYADVSYAYQPSAKKSGFIIRFDTKESMTTDVIAHESVHVALCVCNEIGAIVDLQNQEFFAYLVQHIAKCCEEVKNFEKA